MPADSDNKSRDLSKLTVAQLKALCKEIKISGYSKLGKPALIQKLVEGGYSAANEAIPSAGSSAPPLAVASTTAHAIPAGSHSGGGVSNQVVTENSTTSSIIIVKSKVPKSKAKPKVPKKALPPVQPVQPAHDTSTITTTPAAQVPQVLSAHDSEAVALLCVPNDGAAVSSSSMLASPGNGHIAPSASFACASATATTFPNDDGLVSTQAQGKKRPRTDKPTPPPASLKKPRIQPLITSITILQTNLPPAKVSPKSAPPSHLSSSADVSRPIAAVPTVAKPTGFTKASAVAQSIPSVPVKRFKPLLVGKTKSSAILSSMAINKSHLSTEPATQKERNIVLRYLELPVAIDIVTLPTLRPITMPPPLVQRKRVGLWAIILSGLSDQERAVCVLVSRTFRYAVYLSASSILTRDYGGRRLRQDVLKMYSQAMTNMWPYLRIREAEVARRWGVYDSSFLPRFFQRCGRGNPIARRLWTSPDHPKQLGVAVRFVLTRAWFELSVGTSSGAKGDPDSWLNGMIVDTQEVVKDEIWSVTIEYPPSATRLSKSETVYVIEATCEVVGRPPQKADGSGSAALSVRADWSAYVSQRMGSSSGDGPLSSHLRWSSHEEFDRGISRVWLKRVAGEGELGVAKRVVAERYVLACVVGNSISGPWLSATAMAQDFAGLSERGAVPTVAKAKNPTVNLYLPEHHHVESVHFTAAGGKALHLALATVQTPHREYYILRDNGMQVGCEEEGVAAVWQEVLGCDHRGLSTTLF
ncbi:hypothetical protein C8Q79DRAFT_951600 [Trametes meyenii]|nr:hypothetical protein C8Q79DRAFT_951600 [Trametes meyenii]